ncbi:TfoX/Sxy family protein [Mesorhizobium sp. WSM4884]|uniref:TfoX/Sxy family protein n=1 Tax=Mesorhizobium sp. WSM4884 TaxID=3038542 RepID=UPI0024167BF6|nr:TfoX/Sxy family protein [Mesorhizobium sp. WSM4884]MDG4883858.1 TfoX/Sxy family protein [Mesorhizobium sp. WSM4884]
MAKSVTSTAPDPMVERLRAALGLRAFTEQKMFGGTCFMINGNMLIGTSKRGLLVRVGKEAHGEAAAQPYASPMEMGGRSMEGYVHVAPEGTASEAELGGWLDLALALVETLPPKIKSTKVAKKRA